MVACRLRHRPVEGVDKRRCCGASRPSSCASIRRASAALPPRRRVPEPVDSPRSRNCGWLSNLQIESPRAAAGFLLGEPQFRDTLARPSSIQLAPARPSPPIISGRSMRPRPAAISSIGCAPSLERRIRQLGRTGDHRHPPACAAACRPDQYEPLCFARAAALPASSRTAIALNESRRRRGGARPGVGNSSARGCRRSRARAERRRAAMGQPCQGKAMTGKAMTG